MAIDTYYQLKAEEYWDKICKVARCAGDLAAMCKISYNNGNYDEAQIYENVGNTLLAALGIKGFRITV